MERYVLSMDLRRGDRITDQTGEWEIINRPYVSAGGKLVSAHVRKIDDLARGKAADWVDRAGHTRPVDAQRTATAAKRNCSCDSKRIGEFDGAAVDHEGTGMAARRDDFGSAAADNGSVIAAA